MNCPTCKIALHISERQGIEIDYCQQCRGVWLDRGELDKLIERAGSASSGSVPRSQGNKNSDNDWDNDSDDDRKKDMFGTKSTIPGHGRKERENPLMDLFDFF
jgi:Zn-finger nucleic acid-binding protein